MRENLSDVGKLGLYLLDLIPLAAGGSELRSARSSLEQARFNLVHTLSTCHFQISRLRNYLNFWRLLVGQWMHTFVISNKDTNYYIRWNHISIKKLCWDPKDKSPGCIA